MSAIDDLQKAVGLHQTGQLQEALALYNQVLESEPGNADALHLAGLVHHQMGEHDVAADLIGKAVALNSDTALYLTNYAVVLNVLARFGDAEAAAEKVTEIDQANGLAWHCLGIARLGQREFTGAQTALKTAVSLDPNNAEYLNNLGTAYRNLNQNDLAVSSFRKAASFDQSFPSVHSNLAEALLSQGDMAEAEALCRKNILQFPDHPSNFLTLGRVLMNRSDHRQAKANFEKYLQLRPVQISGHTALAGAQNILGEFSAALTTLEKAAELDPASAEVRQMLGSLHLQLGDQDKAKDYLEEAIQLNPDLSNAYYELSQLRSVDLSPEQQAHLNNMVSQGDLPEASKSVAAFTLARCAEKVNNFGAAFAYLETANKLRLALLNKFGYSFDAAAFASDIQKTIDTFTPEFMATMSVREANSSLPVFVIGLPRSGTTLIERIIASHSDAAGLGELTEIEAIVSTLKSEYGDYPDCLSDLKASDAQRQSDRYVSYLQEREAAALRIVDKNPFNFLHLGLIKTLFPAVPVIYCRRDLRDIGLSCFMQNFADPLPWTNSLDSIGQYFNQYQKLMAHWQQVFGANMLTIDYEEFVVDLETNARSIISHIGLAWDENCLAFHETAGGVQTASSAQVREPISQQSVGRWKNYEEQLKPLIDVLEISAD